MILGKAWIHRTLHCLDARYIDKKYLVTDIIDRQENGWMSNFGKPLPHNLTMAAITMKEKKKNHYTHDKGFKYMFNWLLILIFFKSVFNVIKQVPVFELWKFAFLCLPHSKLHEILKIIQLLIFESLYLSIYIGKMHCSASSVMLIMGTLIDSNHSTSYHLIELTPSLLITWQCTSQWQTTFNLCCTGLILME